MSQGVGRGFSLIFAVLFVLSDACSDGSAMAMLPIGPASAGNGAMAGQASLPSAGAGVAGSNSSVMPPATGGSSAMAGTTAPPPNGMTMMPADPSIITYQRDLRPVLEANCVECHVAGGIGPFPLDTYAAAKQAVGPMVVAVMSGKMPPYPADPDCREVRDDRSLPDETRQLFQKWQQAGTPEGNPADYVAPEKRAGLMLGPPTLMLSGGTPYKPAPNADDYRCFILGDALPNDTYLTAMDIIPDVRNEVHHVQIHRVSAANAAQVRALDAADPAPGYSCLAGTGTLSQNMFSWRPGSVGVAFDKGDAAYIEGGSTLLIQVHYNTQLLPDGQQPAADDTKIALWTLPAGQLPDRIVYRTGVTAQFNIPAGAPHVVAEQAQPMRTVSAIGGAFGGLGGTFVPGEIVGMTPHAHQLASRMAAELRTGSGGKECLVEVSRWDYHWQLDYLYAKGVPYGPDDQIDVTCEYDNSAAHQPVVDGQQLAPRNVTWGEGSLDEMCLHYVWLRFERQAFLQARGVR